MVFEAVGIFIPSLSSSTHVPFDVYFNSSSSKVHFPYPGFDWLPFFTPMTMKYLIALMGISALCVCVGLFYRWTSLLLFLTWFYLYAVESTRTYWMSHYYLVTLVSFLMIWLPAHARYSFDNLLFKKSPSTIPGWSILLLRFQLIITYFYAGVAKLNKDWIFDFEPVGYFLSQPHVPYWMRSQISAGFIAWGGAAFDISIGFLLLHKILRPFAFAILIFFHGINHYLLFRDIGWFPLLGVTTATIFFSPAWPEKIFIWLKSHSSPLPPAYPIKSASARRYLVCGFSIWMIGQIIFPLRSTIIPGDSRITFEGLSFSWRLKAEVYRSTPLKLRIIDRHLIHSQVLENENTNFTLNWNDYHGTKEIQRFINPDSTSPSELPQFLIARDSICGERIFFNPHSSSLTNAPISITDSIPIIQKFWSENFNRLPDHIYPCISIDNLVEGFRKAWAIQGNPPNYSDDQMLDYILRKHGRNGDGKLLPLIRRVSPFQFDGYTGPWNHFLLIQDTNFVDGSVKDLPTVTIQGIFHKAEFLCGRDQRYRHSGGHPKIIYQLESSNPLPGNQPGFRLQDDFNDPETPPHSIWNYLQDLNISKAMHISSQPFLLQKYAKYVAAQWKNKYNNHPSITAETHISLNGRPFQSLVDPHQDLAQTQIRPLHHHPWIMNLQDPRIPAENVLPGFLNYK
jgi:hypothetical protein